MASESKTKNSINLSNTETQPLSPLESKIIDVLAEGPMTRDQMVTKLGIPRTTLYDACKKLMSRNELTKYPDYKDDAGRGRPQVLFSLLDEDESNAE